MTDDREPPAGARFAVQQQARARAVAVDQPRLIEERSAHRPGVVEHRRLHQRAHAPAAHGARRDRLDLDRHRGLLARAQLRDRARLAAVARQVFEQLPHLLDAQRPQPVGELAGGNGKLLSQPRGPRPANGGVQQLCARGRAGAGECAKGGGALELHCRGGHCHRP
jgi:hypothetical protein